MKILSVAHTPSKGGANISWLNTLRGLKSKGVELMVVSPQKDFLTDRLEEIGIPYEIAPSYYCVYPIERKGIANKLLFLPRLAYRLAVNALARKKVERAARKFRPDIIHTNGAVLDIGYRVARRLGVPHVWHLREYVDLDFGLDLMPSKKSYFAKIREKSHSISITPDIYRHYGIKEQLGRVIYNGIVDTALTGESRQRKCRFIFAGEVTEGKGVSDLIQAYRMYRAAGGGYPLEILGHYEEDYKEAICAMLREDGLEEDVIFRGQVDNVADFMMESKAIIVPSKNEGFGRITAEAMGFGCMVVGRDTGGTKLQFDTGQATTGREVGLRFATIGQLAERMREVEDMPPERLREITEAARRSAETNYSIESNVNETLSYFKTVLKL